MGPKRRFRHLRDALRPRNHGPAPAVATPTGGGQQQRRLQLPQDSAEIIAAFHRDGFCHIPGVLKAEECADAREALDQLFESERVLPGNVPRPRGSSTARGEPPGHLHSAALSYDEDVRQTAHAIGKPLAPYIIRRVFELAPIFRDLLVREPILTLMHDIFGAETCQLCGNPALRTQEGAHRAAQWHIDGPLWYPLPADAAPHKNIPCHWLTVQVALSDVVSPEDGPTQYVVGSHLSGREPPTREPPDIDPELEFAGNGTASVFCRAGDIYLCARNNARMLNWFRSCS